MDQEGVYQLAETMAALACDPRLVPGAVIALALAIEAARHLPA